MLTENAGVILSDNKPFWQVMLDDFAEFQKFGVDHPNLERYGDTSKRIIERTPPILTVWF